ncbi:SDR family NAD(P)-dependent oxidoreductase [Mucilaginibacter pallidiroseus]|uniref:SDR family NAD(P)-dependent oxidoreductase n=1 Tax=Mucilaginibacter pallidiroseus TaxID=2599295 RepID=A0A563UG10_9SPHI|nr:SDR family NAD(P)-dependent oxidoreductase [Mucilaginibacter pallidiroseus]TWR30298.1 SDR family NAD(P)-dependent oxidoreductase [Mucilaginibacter pallidiroseus]
MKPLLTAIVTGASEGLGKAFSVELARRGINLLMVSLPGTGLNHLSTYLQKSFDVKADYLELDLTLQESYTGIFDYLKQNNTTAHILINNVGLGNWDWFIDKSTAFYKTQLELNVMTPVMLTRVFLGQVDDSVTSYILNVGSLGGLFVVPKKATYGASKAFIAYFTKCMQLELHGRNVKMSLLSPGGINTKPELLVMNQKLKGIAAATIFEAEDVARIAIDGLFKGKKEIVPGAANKFLVTLNGLLPAFIKNAIVKRKLKDHG